MKTTVGHTVLELVEGDLTRMEVDAIVNAANEMLKHGGGVAGAILRRGGREIQQESDAWVKLRGPVPVGGTAITTAGNLPARYVIHTVGPMMGEGNEDEKLEDATLNCLTMADAKHLKSIAFPAVSSGIFGVPISLCARVMLETVIDYLEGDTGLGRVIFCLWGKEALETFSSQLSELRAGRKKS